MISFKNYPVDIFICLLWSVILLPIALFDISGLFRIIFSAPVIFFIPGYILIIALFPTRDTSESISFLTRMVLSLGFSIVIVSLIGFCLNFTSWGLRLESIIISICIFIICLGIIAIYRWFKTPVGERFFITFDISRLSSKNKLEKVLTVLIILSIIITGLISIYLVVTPKIGEKFTSFFILNKDRNITNYPMTLSKSEEEVITIGISNHEYEVINYTVEIWLIEEEKNSSIIKNMWVFDKISVLLNHTELEIGNTLKIQWLSNYSFSINKTGSFKLMFLLYKYPTNDYIKDINYADIYEDKIKNSYRETHIWINIT
jgi:uncharacterized membrane protein